MKKNVFSFVLDTLRYGAVKNELDEKFEACVDAARLTGKQATLTLTLKIKPKGEDHQLFIQDGVKCVIPELDKPDTLLFIAEDDKGNVDVTRNDPRKIPVDNLKVVESITPKDEVNSL